jgi:hypothetical protein
VANFLVHVFAPRSVGRTQDDQKLGGFERGKRLFGKGVAGREILAVRRARKLRLRLGGDPAGDEYPDKPPRMRWATYNRLMDRLVAADGVADERLLAARLLWDQTA